MRNKTTPADDIYAEPIYRLRRDLEDTGGLMVETIRVVAISACDDAGRVEIVLTSAGNITIRPARLTAAEQRERRAQQYASQPGQLLMFSEEEYCTT